MEPTMKHVIIEILADLAGPHNILEVITLASSEYHTKDAHDKKRYRDYVKLFAKLYPTRMLDISLLKSFIS
jgi:hypothetical protein